MERLRGSRNAWTVRVELPILTAQILGNPENVDNLVGNCKRGFASFIA